MKTKGCFSFDKLYGIVVSEFEKIVDHRANNISYTLSNILKSGFAIFSLKSPSLLSYQKRSVSEVSNLNSIYKISSVPGDTCMRETLDHVDWRCLRKLFCRLYRYFKLSGGGIENYNVLGNYKVMSVDGVHYYSSEKIKCAHCLTKNHSDGTVSYHHSMLCAVMVHPDQSEVIPLDCEPIIKSDGQSKNDCELNASKRLLTSILKQYKKEKCILVEDALYATNPNVKQIISNGWGYVLRVKDTSQQTIFSLYHGRKQRGQLIENQIENDSATHYYSYMNNALLNNQKDSVRVNFLHYEHTNTKGRKQQFDWITHQKLNQSNVETIAKIGRSRWKIENETFNTLKNQGYNFEHNYGHGHSNLSSVMALLMLLAFTIDQIQQHTSQLFQALVKELKTRIKLWEAMRNVFTMITVDSMDTLLLTIAQNWQIALEDP